jgi:cell division protein FtsQ
LRALTREILPSLCIAAAVAALTAATIYMVSYLIYPVTGIEVRGARMFPESEAWEAVPDRASLLTLNPAILERKIESNLWVEGAEVRKNWDSGIVAVEVKERRAVLDAEVEGRRKIFAADGTELPGLGGASLERVELDEDGLEGILRAGRVLESNGVALESVDGVGAGGIEATVGGRTVIFSGGVGEAQAKALPTVMSENPDAPRFDLRTDGRVVVGAGTLEGSRRSGSEDRGVG